MFRVWRCEPASKKLKNSRHQIQEQQKQEHRLGSFVSCIEWRHTRSLRSPPVERQPVPG